jgi:hypothetical protein
MDWIGSVMPAVLRGASSQGKGKKLMRENGKRGTDIDRLLLSNRDFEGTKITNSSL